MASGGEALSVAPYPCLISPLTHIPCPLRGGDGPVQAKALPAPHLHLPFHQRRRQVPVRHPLHGGRVGVEAVEVALPPGPRPGGRLERELVINSGCCHPPRRRGRVRSWHRCWGQEGIHGALLQQEESGGGGEQGKERACSSHAARADLSIVEWVRVAMCEKSNDQSVPRSTIDLEIDNNRSLEGCPSPRCCASHAPVTLGHACARRAQANRSCHTKISVDRARFWSHRSSGRTQRRRDPSSL